VEPGPEDVARVGSSVGGGAAITAGESSADVCVTADDTSTSPSSAADAHITTPEGGGPPTPARASDDASERATAPLRPCSPPPHTADSDRAACSSTPHPRTVVEEEQRGEGSDDAKRVAAELRARVAELRKRTVSPPAPTHPCDSRRAASPTTDLLQLDGATGPHGDRLGQSHAIAPETRAEILADSETTVTSPLAPDTLTAPPPTTPLGRGEEREGASGATVEPGPEDVARVGSSVVEHGSKIVTRVGPCSPTSLSRSRLDPLRLSDTDQWPPLKVYKSLRVLHAGLTGEKLEVPLCILIGPILRSTSLWDSLNRASLAMSILPQAQPTLVHFSGELPHAILLELPDLERPAHMLTRLIRSMRPLTCFEVIDQCCIRALSGPDIAALASTAPANLRLGPMSCDAGCRNSQRSRDLLDRQTEPRHGPEARLGQNWTTHAGPILPRSCARLGSNSKAGPATSAHGRTLQLLVKFGRKVHRVSLEQDTFQTLFQLQEQVVRSILAPRHKANWAVYSSMMTLQFPATLTASPIDLKEGCPPWEALLIFAQQGGICEVRWRTKGGADAGLSQFVTSASPTEWDALDQMMTQVMQQPEDAMQSDDLGAHLAMTLIGTRTSAQLSVIAAVQQLDNPHGCCRAITPARILALVAILSRGAIPRQVLPAWITSNSLLSIRLNGLRLDDLVPPATPIGSCYQDQQKMVSDGVFSLLIARLRDLPLRLPNGQLTQNGVLVKKYIRVEMNLATTQHVDVTVVLPNHANTIDLLNGGITFTPESYATLCPAVGFVEVPMDRHDSAVLDALGELLGLSAASKRLLIASSLSHHLGTYVHVRYTSCAPLDGRPTKEPRKGPRTEHFDPGPASPKSELMIGIDLVWLLKACRDRVEIPLTIGCQELRPVAIGIRVPMIQTASYRALANGMLKSTPLKVVPINKAPNPPLVHSGIIIGPLPRDWTSKANPGRDRALDSELQMMMCRSLVELPLVERADFAGRGTPYALMVDAGNPRNAQHLVQHFSQTFIPTLSVLFDTDQFSHVLVTGLPPECLDQLNEKHLKEAIAEFKQLAGEGDGPAAAGHDRA